MSHLGRQFVLALAACVLPAVVAAEDKSPSTFDRDVMAVLSQAGCNMGACHGNLNGKGGFKLSLRGEDAAFDFASITRQFGQRRVDVFSPEESLLLQKAVGRLGHGGGKRFARDSQAYQLLRDWMSAGAKGPDTKLPALASLEVTPAEIVDLEDQADVPLKVTATFADGETRDVTALATFETSNTLVSVSSEGVVHREDYGEATVLVRYLRQQLPVRVAFVRPRKEFTWHGPPPANQIDEFIFDKLQSRLIQPSNLCDDATFCRRVWLDITGALPSPDDAQAFAADGNPDKRERLIDALLARPEYADFWTLKWSDLLRTEEKILDPRGVEVFHNWIRTNIKMGRRLDAFVRDLVSAEGSTYDNPPVNFYRVQREATARGETVARLFLGVRLQCARCHNHPFDRWTMDDYYSWSALFSRIDYKVVTNERRDKLDLNEFNGEQFIIFSGKGEMVNPRTNRPAKPKFLGDVAAASKDKHRLSLDELAEWLTSPDNDLFAKAQANLIWYHLLGRGLIDPIDDVRATNPASHPELLEWLSRQLRAKEFDLRQMIRRICSSTTYQLACTVNETNRADDVNYSHAVVRRLTAEQLVDAQSQVLGVRVEFHGYPKGTWARQMRGVPRTGKGEREDGDILLRTFGKNSRLLACECERSSDATLQQAFVLIGDEGLGKRLESDQALPARIAATAGTNQQVIEQLYWTVLSRGPTSAEVSAGEALLQNSDRKTTIVDLTWALMNSKEFLFRH